MELVKKLIIGLILSVGFLVSSAAFATQQAPDYLRVGSDNLIVETSWAYPSPVTLYYQQKKIKNPFKMLSTGNYRGHVAQWEVANGKLYLKDIHIGNDIKNPGAYGIYSAQPSPSASGAVFADWFSGLIRALQYPNTEEIQLPVAAHVYYVKDGEVVDSANILMKDFAALTDGEPENAIEQSQNSAKELLAMYSDYTDFYFRLNYGEPLYAKDFKGRIYPSRGSLLWSHSDFHIMNWPYNWENREVNGAPNCHWSIENGRLFLTKVSIVSGSGIYEAEETSLEISDIFPENKSNEEVFASWYSGVILMHHTDTPEKETYAWTTEAKVSFIKIADGKVEQIVTIEPPFEFGGTEGFSDPEVETLFSLWQSQQAY